MSRRCSLWLLAAIVAWILLACGWSVSANLNRKGAYDERFSVRNVRAALRSGSLHPQNGWYSRLSYLPQTGILIGYRLLHELTGAESVELLKKGGDLTPQAYFLVRFFSVLCGAGGAIMTFLIGRRLFSPEVALLGTGLLVACPWLIRHFLIFKADSLTNLLLLIAFYWTLDAADDPTPRRYALAGLGIGLVTSAKYTGALIAIPIIVATVLARDRWSRRVQRLALAGTCSVAVFLLFHPDLRFYWGYFRRSFTRYLTVEQNSFASMLASEAKILLHEAFHGPVIGALALAGLGALCVHLYRLRGDESRFRKLAIFLSFPFGYSVVYAIATSLPKSNNYLVLLPFTSLAAAWLLRAAWSGVAARLPEAGRRLVLWPALVGLLGMVAWPANAFIYTRSVTKTTLDRAGEMIKTARFLSQRSAVFEPDIGPLTVNVKRRDYQGIVATRGVPALSDEPEAALNVVDYEIFGEGRLRGPERDFYLRRMGRLKAEQIVTIRPEWFRSRGSSQVLLWHPWYPATRAMPIEWKRERRATRRFVGRLPAGLRPNALVSLDISLPRGPDHIVSLVVGESSLVLLPTGSNETSLRFRTERFRVSRRNLRVRLKLADRWRHQDPPQVAVWRWIPHRLGGGRRR